MQTLNNHTESSHPHQHVFCSTLFPPSTLLANVASVLYRHILHCWVIKPTKTRQNCLILRKKNLTRSCNIFKKKLLFQNFLANPLRHERVINDANLSKICIQKYSVANVHPDEPKKRDINKSPTPRNWEELHNDLSDLLNFSSFFKMNPEPSEKQTVNNRTYEQWSRQFTLVNDKHPLCCRCFYPLKHSS